MSIKFLVISFIEKMILYMRRLQVKKVEFKTVRRNHRRCSIKKAVLRNYAIFTGKHLCVSRFLIKLQFFNKEHLLRRTSANGCFWTAYNHI